MYPPSSTYLVPISHSVAGWKVFYELGWLTIISGLTSAIRSVTMRPLSSPTFMRYFLVRAYSSTAARTFSGEPRISLMLGLL